MLRLNSLLDKELKTTPREKQATMSNTTRRVLGHPSQAPGRGCENHVAGSDSGQRRRRTRAPTPPRYLTRAPQYSLTRSTSPRPSSACWIRAAATMSSSCTRAALFRSCRSRAAAYTPWPRLALPRAAWRCCSTMGSVTTRCSSHSSTLQNYTHVSDIRPGLIYMNRSHVKHVNRRLHPNRPPSHPETTTTRGQACVMKRV